MRGRKLTGGDDIRRALEQALGAALSEGEWNLLRDEGDVGELEHQFAGDEWADADALDAAVRKIRRMRKAYRGAGAANERGRFLTLRQRSEPGNPLEALSALVALQAAQDEEVVHFRGEALGGRLLTLGETMEWVTKVRALDGPPTLYLEIPWPAGSKLIIDERGGALLLDPPLVVHNLLAAGYCGQRWEFLDLPDRRPGRCRHDSGQRAEGLLDDLRKLGKLLADRYTWGEIEAVGFALPAFPPISPG